MFRSAISASRLAKLGHGVKTVADRGFALTDVEKLAAKTVVDRRFALTVVEKENAKTVADRRFALTGA